MQQTIINIENLGLPPSFAEKLGSKKVLISEVADGILLSPVKNVSKLRGKYKGMFSTEKYLEQKRVDKELEA